MDGEPRISPALDLKNRGVLTEIGGELKATLYGLLAFGKAPQAYPQTRSFWVECVAYAGRCRSDEVLQVAEARGRIGEQAERALGWFRSLGRGERYRNGKRENLWIVPEKALREALVNAVVHRDYAILGSKILVEVFDDRIDITNPGTLPNHMTPESVRAGGHPRSRNELLANFMVIEGWMEQRGRGWPVMRKAMLEHHGLEPVLFEDRDSRFVRVSLPVSPLPTRV